MQSVRLQETQLDEVFHTNRAGMHAISFSEMCCLIVSLVQLSEYLNYLNIQQLVSALRVD